jgi:tRNA(adenine34) deaminase
MKPRLQDEAIMDGLLEFLGTNNPAKEVPVAAGVYDSNLKPLALSTNHRESTSDPSAHAEICVLRETGQVTGNWNLEGLTLFITLEPCLMCAGAILQSRISRVVFGAFSSEISSDSTIDLLRASNSRLEVVGGVRNQECSLVLSQWFSKQRIEKG